MHIGPCSLIVIVVLYLTVKSATAITGCIVTLINSASDRRKVLCADPKTPIDSIPTGLPQRTDMLIISHQNITNINEKDLVTIAHTTTLLLTFSNLHKVHKLAFKTLSHLLVLDLSGNNLVLSEESFPVEVLKGLLKLQYLRLTGNPLAFIPDSLFQPVSTTLRKIFLNKCNIPRLELSGRVFQGLHNVDELDLRESALTGLAPTMEVDLRAMKSLKTLLLGGNKFLCDCNLRWLYFYLIQVQETVTVTIEGDKDPLCSGPEKLANKRFPVKEEKLQLKHTDFLCAPNCSIAAPTQFVAEPGTSVNFTCQCVTDPIQRLIWTKNGHIVEEQRNKYKISHIGQEAFNSTLNIASLSAVDSGNWSCNLEGKIYQNFSLKVKSSTMFSTFAYINIYVLVGLGTSLFLVVLVIIIIVMFCRRESLCDWRNQHPMVICGYQSNIRKLSNADGDSQFRFNEHDGRFNTSFYENTIPFDSALSHQYDRTNHLLPEEFVMDKQNHLSKPNNEKMLNMYCGCNYNSGGEEEEGNSVVNRSSSAAHRPRPLEPFHESMLNPEEKFQQLRYKAAREKPLPKTKQCPLHGSSGTLTRIPGEKPCPVHGSTATLPTRLSSRRVEHRFGCPKHNADNISVKSLKVDSAVDSHSLPHRSKSVARIPTKLNHNTEKLAIQTPTGYRPCPLHGDILAAINENIFESRPSNNGVHLNNSEKNHSKVLKEKSLKIPAHGCEKIGRKPMKASKHQSDRFQVLSVSISNALTSPVQSSLSSSPLLTSDVHGTLV